MTWECIIIRDLKCENCGTTVEEIDVDENKTYICNEKKIEVVNRKCPNCNTEMEEGSVCIIHKKYLSVDFWIRYYDYIEPEAARSLAEAQVKATKIMIDRLKKLGVID